MKQLYTDYDKEFISLDLQGTTWHTSISRAEYASLSVPMISEEMSDEQMQKIVDNIALAMYSEYDGKDLDLLAKYRSDVQGEMDSCDINRADDMSEREFEHFESVAREFGMRYWEDLDDDEIDELNNEIEKLTKK